MEWCRVGAAFAGAGVALGAMGAHAFSAKLGTYGTPIYQTAVNYHLFHAMALLFLGLAVRNEVVTGATARIAGGLFSVGILLFSGSLYALALTGERSLGMITPFGGVMFLVGWLLLARGSGAVP